MTQVMTSSLSILTLPSASSVEGEADEIGRPLLIELALIMVLLWSIALATRPLATGASFARPPDRPHLYEPCGHGVPLPTC
jgi:hypothetical protein